jgi:PilZ domain
MDNRRHVRDLTLLTAKVSARSTASPINCAVLNISESGACILVPAGADISETFVLAIDPDRRSRNCRTVWRNGCLVGLKFDEPE